MICKSNIMSEKAKIPKEEIEYIYFDIPGAGKFNYLIQQE